MVLSSHAYKKMNKLQENEVATTLSGEDLMWMVLDSSGERKVASNCGKFFPHFEKKKKTNIIE